LEGYYKKFSDQRKFSLAYVGRRGGGYPDLAVYSQTEVISALRKEIKLADVDKAIYWAYIMLEYGDQSFVRKLARQLVVMSAEDLHDDSFTLESVELIKRAKKGEVADSDLYDAVARACHMEKWWETHYGRSVDYAWGKAQGEYKSGKRKMPDMETILIEAGQAIDEKRFDDAMALTHVIVDICGDVKLKRMYADFLMTKVLNGDYVDGCDIRAKALKGLFSAVIGETDMFYFLVAKMIQGYEQEKPSPGEQDWLPAFRNAQAMTNAGEWYEMPMYAVDQHTLRGAMMKRRGEFIDNRFNGTEAGRAKTCYLFKRDGKLDRNAAMDDEGITFVKAILAIYGSGKPGKSAKMASNTSTQLRLL
jgi:hypothetical protein